MSDDAAEPGWMAGGSGRGRRHWFGPLRVRLILVLALAMLPVAAVSMAQALQSYWQEREQVRDELTRLVDLAAGNELNMVAGVQRLLQSLGRQPIIRTGGTQACGDEMAAVLEQSPEYAAVLRVGRDGQVDCAAPASVLGRDLSAMPWMVQARARPGMALADGHGFFGLGPVLVAAQALTDGSVLVATVRLDWLQRLSRAASRPTEAVVRLVDAQGESVIAGPKPSADAELPDPVALREQLGPGPSWFELRGDDGVMRMFAAAPLHRTDIYVLFGEATADLLGGARWGLISRLITPVAMWAVAVLAAWIATDVYVLRWIRRLHRTTGTLARGVFDTKPGVESAPDEIRQLGEAFGVMAENLARRTTALEASVIEREALIKEVHHRVKNNLQIITSLLNLQGKALRDPVARRGLAEAQTRINALALVHRGIYETADLRSVEARGFLSGLCQLLRDAMGLRGAAIVLGIEAPAQSLRQEKAVPLALLVTEAVTNALKHGFPEGRSGHVEVTLTRTGLDGHLEIRDDGVGLPELPSKGGIGRSLMAQFARQLGGTLQIVRQNGTVVSVAMPGLWTEPTGPADETLV
jgi:two-component sensor histidine kinase